MKKLVMIVLAALTLVGFFGLAKIQTWSAVGKDALVEKIDHALGEFDVKRTEAAGGVEGLQKTLRVVREGQIRSEVKSEQLDAKLIAVRDRKDQMQSTLQKIRDQVASGETLVLGGKTYEPGIPTCQPDDHVCGER